jgi:hydroxymethylpyrimidine pyrophosphatase-like HAD family hydrolase
VGAPTSAILAEVYIPYMEHEKLYPILKKHQKIGYFRYVDDILIMYNKNKTNRDETLTEFNKQTTSIKFTIEKEQHNSLNFPDLTIH